MLLQKYAQSLQKKKIKIRNTRYQNVNSNNNNKYQNSDNSIAVAWHLIKPTHQHIKHHSKLTLSCRYWAHTSATWNFFYPPIILSAVRILDIQYHLFVTLMLDPKIRLFHFSFLPLEKSYCIIFLTSMRNLKRKEFF